MEVRPLVVGKKVKIKDLTNPKVIMNLNVLRDRKNFNNKTPVIIELDDNKSVTFIPKRFRVGKREGDFSWKGKSKNSRAKAILSVRNGVMVGTIKIGKDTYKLYPENEHFRVVKVDRSKVLPFKDDVQTSFEKTPKQMPALNVEIDTFQENQALYMEEQNSSAIFQRSTPSVSDSVVTLLVYYTQALKDMYGDSTEAMIQNNLDLARDAYIDSNTEIDLEVATIKIVPSNSLLNTADSGSLSDLLNKLSSDGLVRYERELYNADAVTVFSKYPENGTGCGLARAPLSQSDSHIDAYSAVHIKPAGGNGYYCSDLSFAHELGHNFGCMHDYDHSGYVGMYPYAYGYNPQSGIDTYHFATIMSYNSPGIDYFSNPDINDTVTSLAIGDAANADNARTIRENQLKVADNSKQISEDLEDSDYDMLDSYVISGYLNNNYDRDKYILWLDKSTSFTMDSPYGDNAFYVNIYNESTHEFIDSFDESGQTLILDKGRYRVTIAFYNDSTGYYYLNNTMNYTVSIDTEYVPSISPAIINYLLN